MQQWLNLLFQIATPVFNTLIYGGTSYFLNSLQDEIENKQKQQAKQMLGCLGIGNHLKIQAEREVYQEKLVDIGHQRILEIQDIVENFELAINQDNVNYQLFSQLKSQPPLKQETVLQLAAYQRETNLLLLETQKKLDSWPLQLFPNQLLESATSYGKIPLRVILVPPQIPQEKLEIESKLTQGLREFLAENYSLHSPVRPTEFLGGAWQKDREGGEASIKTIFQALKFQPTLILESEIEKNVLCLRLAYWGCEQANYCYQTVFKIPYREFLEESAKARAWQWQATRDKLLALGKTPAEIKQMGGVKAHNLALLEEAAALQAAGVDLEDLEFSYQIGSQDFDALCQLLTTCHCLVAGWVADIHYLIHSDSPPILPQLLSQFGPLPETSRREIMHETVALYQEIFKALMSDRPDRVPEISLKLAQSLAYLPDRTLAREQVNYSLRTWLQERQISPLHPGEDLTAIQFNLTAQDRDYLAALQTCLSALGDEGAATQVQQLLTVNPNWQQQLHSFTLRQTLEEGSGKVTALALSPDGQKLVSGGEGSGLALWELPPATNRCQEVCPIPLKHPQKAAAFTFALSPDGQVLVTSDCAKHRSRLYLWNLPQRKLQRILFGHKQQIRSLAFSPDGQLLASGSHKIKLWNLQTGESCQTLFGHKEWVSALSISTDGEMLISGSEDKRLRVWNLRTGELLRTLSGHQGSVRAVALSPDGSILVSGSEDKTIKLWDWQAGKLLNTLTAHAGSVYTLAFACEGKYLLSGSADRTIKVWHFPSGELHQILAGHSAAVRALALSADGETLVSGGGDKTIKIWQAA